MITISNKYTKLRECCGYLIIYFTLLSYFSLQMLLLNKQIGVMALNHKSALYLHQHISPIRMTTIKYPRNPLYPSTTKQDDLRFIREDELSNDMASDLYQSPLLDVQPDLDAPLLQHQSLQRYRYIARWEEQ